MTKAAEAPPPPEVTTRPVEPHDIDLTYTYAGRITAFRQVEVRARVGGTLLHRFYREGARVKAGDPLFQIDPTPYEASVERAVAQLLLQEAQRDKAQRDLRRTSTLLASQAGTLLARDDALSALSVAEAGVAAAQADLRGQQLNLAYTNVAAPISGVTSLEAVPEGSVIGTAPETSLLTRITQTDPIFVTFAFDSDDLAEIRSLTRRTANPQLTAWLTADGRRYTGAIDFTDANMDAATGTVHGRALFQNSDNALLPGQFVRITLGGVTLPHTLTVPKMAVGQDAAGTFVYAADNNHARRVDVELKRETDRDWVVSGISPGDQVILEGLVHVREGEPVRIVSP